MHLHSPSQWAWLPLMLLLIARVEGGYSRRNHLDLARTDNRLMRLPFFGGGVGHLLRYLHPLAMADPLSPRGRINELRSELDPNYVSYRGAQLWKLNFNATRGSSMEEDREEEAEAESESEELELEQGRQVDGSPDAQFNEVVALFGESLAKVLNRIKIDGRP